MTGYFWFFGCIILDKRETLPMPTTDKRPLKVFLCHASTDKPKVRELYRYLKKRGIQPWFDEEDLVGGQDWQVEIPKALATSDAIIICLTKNSVDKEGYIQKEIKFALDKALEMPEGRIFLIPVKFEECEVPFTLNRYQWVDLTVESGYAKMMKALKFRASQLERSTIEVSKKDVLEKIVSREEKVRDEAEHVEKQRKEKEERERQTREVSEKAKQEKEERQSARKNAVEKALHKSFIKLKSVFAQAIPILRIIGIIGIIITLFWVGSLAVPGFLSLVPTAQPSATSTRVITRIPSTKTLVPTATKTKTPKPTSTRIPTQTPTIVVQSQITAINLCGENIYLFKTASVDNPIADGYIAPNATFSLTGKTQSGWYPRPGSWAGGDFLETTGPFNSSTHDGTGWIFLLYNRDNKQCVKFTRGADTLELNSETGQFEVASSP